VEFAITISVALLLCGGLFALAYAAVGQAAVAAVLTLLALLPVAGLASGSSASGQVR
jgi:hypothetical protein